MFSTAQAAHFAAGLLPFRFVVRYTSIPTAEPESDDALMARFCDGDEDAFAVLYDRYAPQLEAFLRRFVRDRALAEDLLQTTFLSVVRARGRYTPLSGLRGWIYAIAANASRDALRRRGARPELSFDPALLSDLAPASQDADPTLAASDPNMARAVDQALQQLPPDQREAVLLHKVQGLSFPEIASALGTTVGAAKVRAHRGYQRLKILLAAWENA
jgi:RNA polymerase sigma-70 factor (ECF subfamily)